MGVWGWVWGAVSFGGLVSTSNGLLALEVGNREAVFGLRWGVHHATSTKRA